MATDKDTMEGKDTATKDVATNGEQENIDWAEAVMKDRRPSEENVAGDGEDVDEGEGEGEGEGDEVSEDTIGGTGDDIEAFGEGDWEKKVEIKNKDGGVEYKTIGQLVKEGMFEADYCKKTTDISRQRGQLEEDRAILNLINNDKASRAFFTKRLEDIKDGRGDTDDFDILTEEELENAQPWLKKLIKKVKENTAELSQSRASQKQSQANQTVGKMDSVLKAAQTAIEGETGLKLKPDEFRARVGSAIINSMSEDVPEDKRVLIAGQMILTDKDYYLSKARSVYQQERELARDKAITKAKDKKSAGAKQKRTLSGGGATGGTSADVDVVKDAKGKPDMKATIESFYLKGGAAK